MAFQGNHADDSLDPLEGSAKGPGEGPGEGSAKGPGEGSAKGPGEGSTKGASQDFLLSKSLIAGLSIRLAIVLPFLL